MPGKGRYGNQDQAVKLTETAAGDRVEVYRLRVALSNQSGSGSGGDWTLYTSRQGFEEATLSALIEEAAHLRNRGVPGGVSRSARSWLRSVMREGKDVQTNEWTTWKVVAAEQLVDGQWVDLGARLVPPSLVFDAEARDD